MLKRREFLGRMAAMGVGAMAAGSGLTLEVVAEGASGGPAVRCVRSRRRR